MPPASTNLKGVASFLQESLNLQKALADGLTPAGLSHWSEDSAVRQALLKDTVWGQIRWPRNIGRPLSATLAEAFVISHDYHYVKIVQTGPGDYIEQDIWATRTPPLTWDGPADPKDYVVSYFASAVAGWPNRISVSLAPGVSWSALEIRGYRLIEPAPYIFLEVGERVQVPDFTVAVVPWLNGI